MNQSFFRLIKAGNDRQLICFHHAGGNAEYFLPWKTGILNEIAIYAIQLPGHGTRINESLLTNIHQMADEIANNFYLLPLRETLFFGHSMGAILAFEVALRLQKENLVDLSILCVSGRLPPHQNTGTNFYQQDEKILLQKIMDLNEGQKDYRQSELLTLLLPIFRADFKAIERYQFNEGNQLNCPIIACLGNNDSEVSTNQMQEWQKVTTKAFMLKTFPGGHFYLNHQLPHLLNFLNSIFVKFCRRKYDE